MSQKVSIVVPIYKVEKYLRRCLDSILSQTYFNIELILVDDGSPDNCGRIADEYAIKDRRIKVFHKQNGGLSDARNHGMGYVTGEFTVFVDSDDWLSPKMIEEMVNKSFIYDADIVQAAFYYTYDDCLLLENRYNSKDDPPVVLDNRSLMSELVKNNRVKNFAWGKLYRTAIIRDIPFEKGVLFEDVFWAYKVMHRVKTYLILNQPMCYYYQRSDSIVATYTSRNLDILKGLKARHLFIEEYYQDLIDESYKLILKTSLIHYNLLLANRTKDKRGLYRKEIQLYIKNNYKKLKKAVENDQQLRKQLFLFAIHPGLNVLFIIAHKILGKLTLRPDYYGFERIPL
jgi:glycosyltransferase involved in cell wall biosynthesis